MSTSVEQILVVTSWGGTFYRHGKKSLNILLYFRARLINLQEKLWKLDSLYPMTSVQTRKWRYTSNMERIVALFHQLRMVIKRSAQRAQRTAIAVTVNHSTCRMPSPWDFSRACVFFCTARLSTTLSLNIFIIQLTRCLGGLIAQQVSKWSFWTQWQNLKCLWQYMAYRLTTPARSRSLQLKYVSCYIQLSKLYGVWCGIWGY